jgi:hypothetical protein
VRAPRGRRWKAASQSWWAAFANTEWAVASIYNATEPNAMVSTRPSSRAYGDRPAQSLRRRARLDKVVISVPHVPQGMLSRYGEPHLADCARCSKIAQKYRRTLRL